MQWIIVICVFVGVYLLMKAKRKALRVSETLLFCLLVTHAATTALYLSSPAGDWKMYYDRGQQYAKLLVPFDYVSPGTRFIVAISHLLHTLCRFDVETMFAIFSLIGLLGVIYLLGACRPKLSLPRDRFWLLILLFYPSLHFWSSAIGKDSIIFFALNFLLFNITRKRYFDWGTAFAVILIFLVRPHVALLVLAAALAASVFSSGVSASTKVAGAIVLGAALLLTIPFVQDYVGVDELSLDAASERIAIAASKNQEGGGAVDITGYSPPARLATYMFRPLFFDARSFFSLVASAENLVLLIVFSVIIRPRFLTFLGERPNFDKLFCVVFIGMMWLMLGMITANLGIAMRQKTQILPFVFYLAVSFRDWERSKERRKALGRRPQKDRIPIRRAIQDFKATPPVTTSRGGRITEY